MAPLTRFSGSVGLAVSELPRIGACAVHLANRSFSGKPEVGQFGQVMGKLGRGALSKVVRQVGFPTFLQDFCNLAPYRPICQFHPAGANPSDVFFSRHCDDVSHHLSQDILNAVKVRIGCVQKRDVVAPTMRGLTSSMATASA